jgi:hypothetical protein
MVVLAVPLVAFIGDPASHPPPASGTYAYNAYAGPSAAGGSYVDPVFGETVRRLTTDHSHDDIYARNMWWSADETRYLHRSQAGGRDRWQVIDVATGSVTQDNIPFGYYAADGGFDPVDPNALYYIVRDNGAGHGEIHKVTLNFAGIFPNCCSDAVYWTAPAPLGTLSDYLGGTINWVDASGRYASVRYGPEPSVRLYDWTNMAAGPYANAIDGTNYIDAGGYIGLSPDGQYLVGYQDGPLPLGLNGSGQGVSWRIDHISRTVAPSPTVFWSLCGDHGSFVSASDGRNYMVVNDCYTDPSLWRADISDNATTCTGTGVQQEQCQQGLPNNKRLLSFASWNDGDHVSTAGRGDWAFLSTEDATDIFNSGADDGTGHIGPWHAYRQEIIAINVTTLEVRRLAHHRSRSVGTDYYSAPRVSVSWSGKVVGFASNFNQPGGGTPLVDIYAIPWVTPAVAAFPGQYQPLTPVRILDTRIGIGGPASPVGAGQVITAQVAGAGGVPKMTDPSPPSAVVLNVTVADATASSYLTVYPTGVARPLASNLNFVAGQPLPNLVEVALGSDGKVAVYNNSGSVDVIFDVAGWVSTQGKAPAPTTAGLYRPLVPVRLLDTRSGVGGSTTMAAGQTISLQVTGNGNVPTAGVSAVVLNVTATKPTAAGYLTIFPAGGIRPLASNLNFVPGQTVPNRVVAKVGSNGQVSFFNFQGNTDVVADVGGWFTDGSDATATGGQFSGLTPARILDSRFGQGTTSAVGANGLIYVQVAGLGSVPAMTATVPPKAVVLNVTVTNTTAASFLTVYPSDAANRPTASDLNWTGGLTVPNLVVVKLGADGKIAIYNLAGSTDVIADVVGWYN